VTDHHQKDLPGPGRGSGGRPIRCLVAIGIASTWGFAAGLVDSGCFGQAELADGWLRLRYLAAAGLLQASVCALVGLGLWGVLSVLPGGTRGERQDLRALISIHVAGILTSVTLVALRMAHTRLLGDVTVFSTAGIGTTFGVFVAALAIGAASVWLASRILSESVETVVRASHAFAIVGGAAALISTGLVSLGLPFSGGGAGAAAGRPNVLLISIDSLRADVWEEYLNEHASPTLRRFVDGSRRYRDAHTSYSHSLASHASMLSGLHPPEHGAVHQIVESSSVGSAIDPSLELLAERLSAEGYETFGVMSNAWLGPPYGLEAGFQTYVNHGIARSLGTFNFPLAMTVSTAGYYVRFAEQFVFGRSHPNSRLLRAWLETRDRSRPFFAFLHYIEMHTPNGIAPDSERFLSGPYAGIGGFEVSNRFDAGEFSDQQMPAVRDHVRALNLAALAQMDTYLAPVLDALMNDGWLENTLVILLSDHGENLYEKAGNYGHGHVYNTVSHVPFVVSVPGEAGGSDRDGLVSVIDVAPTFYAYTETRPPDGLSGRDLSGPGSRTAGTEDDRVYVQGWDHDNAGWARAVLWADGTKLIVNASGDEELYDRVADPHEHHDRVGDQPERARRYRHRFDTLVGAMRQADQEPIDIDSLPSEVSDQLRALGYLK